MMMTLGVEFQSERSEKKNHQQLTLRKDKCLKLWHQGGRKMKSGVQHSNTGYPVLGMLWDLEMCGGFLTYCTQMEVAHL